MMNLIVLFFRFIKNNLSRLLLIILFTIVFVVLLFPFGDLNDLVSSKVSQLTQNSIYLQFEDLNLNPITGSVSLEKISLETPTTDSITADEVTLTPSLVAAVKQDIGGSLTAAGFMKGEISIDISPTTSESGVKKSQVELSASGISLNEVRQAARLNLPLKGSLNLSSQGTIDLNPFVRPNPEDTSPYEQPDFEINVTVAKFELPSTTVSTGMMGALNVPEVKFDKVELKGKLNNGKFLIESGKLGSPSNDVYGDIKGEIGLNLIKNGGRIIPQFGAYNFTIDLKTKPDFQQKAGLFLSFLESSKTMAGTTANYRFRLQGEMLGGPFQMTPIR